MTKLAAVLLTAAAGCSAPPTDAVTSTTSQPILGGTLVAAGEFPTVVALEAGPGQFFCTGTLVGASWVLTAAHCVEGAPQGAIKIRFDGLDVNTGAEGMSVGTKRHVAANFTGAWRDDIALIELTAPVTRPFTKLHREPTPVGSAVKQVGYGVASDEGDGGGILRKLDETNIDCATTGEADINNTDVLCFDPANGGGCYGDSGGPTFIEVGGKLEVTGVTSGGTDPQGRCSFSYGIWTHVASQLAFLDPIMAETPDPDPDPQPDPDPDPTPDPTDPDPVDPAPPGDDGGCAAGGGGGGLGIGVALVGLALGRRRRRA